MLALLHTTVTALAVGAGTSLKDFKATKIDGTAVGLDSFVGKPTVVVNVASL